MSSSKANKKVDVAIIGAGTAGLTARRKVAEKTDSYIVIDDGPLGTICARVGCMPSKVLIQAANDFDRRRALSQQGIRGGDQLSVDGAAVMEHVRSLRDRFVSGVIEGMEDWQSTHLLRERAILQDQSTLVAGNEVIEAKKIILAAGSRPVFPEAWGEFGEFIETTDSVFDWEGLPERVAVIGLGVIGAELGQALTRLGVDVVGITVGRSIGGLSDPVVQDEAWRVIGEEMQISHDGVDHFEREGAELRVFSGERSWLVQKVLLAVGRRPNLDRLGLDNVEGLMRDNKGRPEFDPQSGRIEGTSLYIAGDLNSERPILHEAADEGAIAGTNAVSDKDICYERRVRFGVTFTDPNIAVVGQSYQEVKNQPHLIGEVSFRGQGRSIVKLKEKGHLRVYSDPKGDLLGAELFGPDGEHLAHMLAWAIQLGLGVREVLTLPFYHPVVQEGLRTALREIEKQLKTDESYIELKLKPEKTKKERQANLHSADVEGVSDCYGMSLEDCLSLRQSQVKRLEKTARK